MYKNSTVVVVVVVVESVSLKDKSREEIILSFRILSGLTFAQHEVTLTVSANETTRITNFHLGKFMVWYCKDISPWEEDQWKRSPEPAGSLYQNTCRVVFSSSQSNKIMWSMALLAQDRVVVCSVNGCKHPTNLMDRTNGMNDM